MSVQVRRRREVATFLSTYVGAQGELLVDTTNNRVQVHDGTTPGGWPAAKLSEVVTNTRTAVADASYTALVTDRTIAYTAITSARTVTLPASSSFPTGIQLVVFDESGSCSPTNMIVLAASGSDLINGAAVAFTACAYGVLAVESNGAGRWTLVEPLGTLAVQNSGTTNNASSGAGSFFAHTPTVTLPAGFLSAGRALRILAGFRLTTGSAASATSFRLRAGATPILSLNATGTPAANQANATFGLTFIVQSLGAPSSSANVEASVFGNTNAGTATVTNQVAQPVALPTNAAIVLAIDTEWASAGTGINTLTLSQLIVEALN